jgi:predicted AAA+ superfamily ATPase
VLDKRLSTIPNFQRTRGALRLLARAVRHLWDERPEGVQLIHLHHLDLGDSVIAEELSSRLERPQYEPVIRADVASQPGGENSHAERVDEQMGGGIARRLATTLYLYSLTRDVCYRPIYLGTDR